MGRPRKQYPDVGKRQRPSGRWQLYWKTQTGFYSITVDGPKDEAETKRLELAVALRTEVWPEWAAETRAVRRWEDGPIPTEDEADPLDPYEKHLRANVSRGWAVTALAHLKELRDVAGKPLTEITGRDAEEFLQHILTSPGPNHPDGEPRSRATRNRALAACSAFYRWATRTGRSDSNPFSECKRLTERPSSDIDYLTKEEREQVLAAADTLEDGLAAWIAVYAGLRRSEIARLRWSDVNLDTGTIRAAGKTGERTVPLPEALIDRLAEVPPEERRGRVVPWPASTAQWNWQARRCLQDLNDACPDINPDCIRWNSFRHSFASHLVQAGVSLSKVSAWMGNSPAICRRHYARFVPRDKRDSDIDLLE